MTKISQFLKLLFVSLLGMAVIVPALAANKIEVHNQTNDSYQCQYGNDDFIIQNRQSLVFNYSDNELLLSCKKPTSRNNDKTKVKQAPIPVADDVGVTLRLSPSSFTQCSDVQAVASKTKKTQVISNCTVVILIKKDDNGKVSLVLQ